MSIMYTNISTHECIKTSMNGNRPLLLAVANKTLWQSNYEFDPKKLEDRGAIGA